MLSAHSSVSVIIPSYNRLHLLQNAIDSVVSQSVVPCEVIVVDDGSSDGTVLGVFKASLRNNRAFMRVLRMRHCGMPGAVRNVGIRHARGDYIAFLDSDDVWLADKLALQLPLMKRYDVCHTREVWMRDGVEISQKKQRHTRFGDMFADALHKCTIGPSTALMHRRIFEKHGLFREDLRIAEDYELWLRISARESIGYVDTPLVVKNSRKDTPQLSREFPYIENFRIAALEPLVQGRVFPREKQGLAEKVLKRKLDIWNTGAKKHASMRASCL